MDPYNIDNKVKIRHNLVMRSKGYQTAGAQAIDRRGIKSAVKKRSGRLSTIHSTQPSTKEDSNHRFGSIQMIETITITEKVPKQI